MSGNREIINSDVDTIAIQQFNNLKEAAAAVTEQMVIATRAAIALNNATGGSQSFSVFKRNADATTASIETVLTSINKKQQAEERARQYKADMDEKALNKYLVLMSKQQAAQNAADAKELAAAQNKADKVAQIQGKQDAAAAQAAERRRRQLDESDFPNKPSPTPLIAQEPAEPSPRYTPVITGTEDMSASYRNTTAAVQGETVALTEQEAALRKNIELHLELQAELAAIKAEQKAVNTETAAGAQQMVTLKQRELETNAAIAQNKSAINQQTKEAINQTGSIQSLQASLARLRLSYSQLSESERENAEIGGKMLIEINALDARTRQLALSQGITAQEVGGYERAIQRATSGTALATQAITVATRSIVRMIVQFALFGVIFEAAQAIYAYVKALDIFNPIATAAERAQKAFIEALKGPEYEKGLENILKLGTNLDLAKKGIEDSDNAINQYNETIGKTYGYVNNLNDAQKGFIDNKDAYIKAILDEAAANAIAAKAAQEIADIAEKNQELREQIANFSDPSVNAKNRKTAGDAFVNLGIKQARENAQKIIDNKKRIDLIIKNATGALEDVTSNNSDLTKRKAGADAAAELANKIANEQLEREKIIAQNKINNDKLSYKTRLDAVEAYYKASAQIEKNNTELQLRELPAIDARREDVEKEAANKQLQLQITRDNQLKSLREKQYKQDQDILKNNIQAQKDLFKSVVDDPNQSFSAKKVALEVYNARSMDLIKANLSEETKEAGKNAESKILAQQNYDKATLQLTNETTAEKLKILKEELQKEVTLSKQSQQEQLYELQKGADLALQALTDTKDDKENALALKRSKNLIKEKDFNRQILAINDQFNIDKIAQELAVQQTVLAIQEGQRDSTLIKAKISGASDTDLAKIKSDADKEIDATAKKIAGLNRDLKNATTKKNIDDSKTDADKLKDFQKEFAQDAALAAKAVDLAQQAEDAHYQHQIDLLEEKKALIDETTKAQIDGVNNSILSEADKARKINVINARAAQQKAQIDAQERKAKTEQARFDREAGIAKIIINTAVAVVEALPNYVLAAVVGALGAAELAIAVSTPLPKFATGTLSSPEGFAHVGERGPELRIDPSGKVSLTPGTDTITYLEKGTKIIPNHMIKPEKLNYAGGQQVPWKEVIAAINKNKPEPQKRPVNKININIDSYYQKFYR